MDHSYIFQLQSFFLDILDSRTLYYRTKRSYIVPFSEQYSFEMRAPKLMTQKHIKQKIYKYVDDSKGRKNIENIDYFTNNNEEDFLSSRYTIEILLIFYLFFLEKDTFKVSYASKKDYRTNIVKKWFTTFSQAAKKSPYVSNEFLRFFREICKYLGIAQDLRFKKRRGPTLRYWTTKNYPTALGSFSFHVPIKMKNWDVVEYLKYNPVDEEDPNLLFSIFDEEYFFSLFYFHFVTTSPYQHKNYLYFKFFHFPLKVVKTTVPYKIKIKKKKKKKRGRRH